MILKCFDKISQLVLIIGVIVLFSSCDNPQREDDRVGVLSQSQEKGTEVITGAQNVAQYHPMLIGKKVGMVVNQTSMIGSRHLVDSLLELNVDIQLIFSPEHGFRGTADAGETVDNSVDPKTGVRLISLYGTNKKPSSEEMKTIDVMVFDIQDVGVRFYTYISTLHYVMEACAEANIPLIVLDRPNPNAHYVDGPILESKYKSFIGMHPVPIVYGMTIGEYAQMINGESWLPDGSKADLTVIPNRNYKHSSYYNLPVIPSPNLPNIQSIFLYPSLCFFEGTEFSAGRGTTNQFQIYGHPDYTAGDYQFTPISRPGAKYPKHENSVCHGHSLTGLTKGSLHDRESLDLSYLLGAFQNMENQGHAFFLENNFFEKLAGTNQLRSQLIAHKTEDEIRASWTDGLKEFSSIRSKYLIYE